MSLCVVALWTSCLLAAALEPVFIVLPAKVCAAPDGVLAADALLDSVRTVDGDYFNVALNTWHMSVMVDDPGEYCWQPPAGDYGPS